MIRHVRHPLPALLLIAAIAPTAPACGAAPSGAAARSAPHATATATAIATATPAAPAAAGEDVAIEGVWWNVRRKPERGRAKENREKGTLTIADGTLRFVGGKHDLTIPLADVSWVHSRRLRDRDDVDWIVLEVARERVHLLRDGRRFGFGGRTPEILDTLTERVREAGSGQFAAPPGRQAFAQLDGRTVFTLPAGWKVEKRLEEFREGRLVAGRVVFAPGDAVAPGGDRRDADRLQPRVELALRAAPRGARCDGIDESVLRELRGEGAGPVETVAVGRCTGARWTHGDRVTVAVAHEDTLYAMTGVARDAGADAAREAAAGLDAIAATWRFPLLP